MADPINDDLVGIARHNDGRINIAAACMAGHIVHLGLAEALVLERKALECRIAELEAARPSSGTGSNKGEGG